MKEKCCLDVLWDHRVALFGGPSLSRFPHREGEPGYLPPPPGQGRARHVPARPLDLGWDCASWLHTSPGFCLKKTREIYTYLGALMRNGHVSVGSRGRG